MGQKTLYIYPGVAQLVARVIWDHEAAGSNPVTRTIKTHNSKSFSNNWDGSFLFYSSVNSWMGDEKAI